MSDSEPQLSPGRLARLACLLEATARKPGNVHPGAAFDDLTYDDFLLSADAIAAPLDRAGADGVGPAILAAVRATRRAVATNTNLGMVLLLAPLAAVPAAGRDLAAGVARVLAGLTVADARDAYEAIRLAAPGGLGRAAEQDVAGEPGVTLREAMRLAAGHDLVARQYATDYEDVLGVGLPALREAIAAGVPVEGAIVRAQLLLLAARPDSLIARKRGRAVAEEASRRAAAAYRASAGDYDPGSAPLRELDTWLRGDGHARNPGATADLVAAALYAALRDGSLAPPRDDDPSGWPGAAVAATMAGRRPDRD
jgi:triphosphoribosyl-dephospho-CoA synthase